MLRWGRRSAPLEERVLTWKEGKDVEALLSALKVGRRCSSVRSMAGERWDRVVWLGFSGMEERDGCMHV